MSKIQYLGFFLLFLAYYFDHWPYREKSPMSCRILGFICLTGAGACLGYVLSN